MSWRPRFLRSDIQEVTTPADAVVDDRYGKIRTTYPPCRIVLDFALDAQRLSTCAASVQAMHIEPGGQIRDRRPRSLVRTFEDLGVGAGETQDTQLTVEESVGISWQTMKILQVAREQVELSTL